MLRIEDTDIERSQQQYTDSILESLAWCSITPDEPIVVQSQRKAEHLAVAQKMLKDGTAYRCFCTQEELQKRLGVNAADGSGYVKYDRKCRDKVITTEDLKKQYVIRFKIPLDREEISFDDLIHGLVTFSLDTLDDFIIVRSDSTPMYNFVVVVDDAFMRISHIIRGEEHLINTPKQLLLYEACGYKIPLFAHTPLILGSDGTKLSKRDAATAVIDYKQNGFLPEALCNYLVRLGWSHGDQEIFSRQELINYFSLENVGKKGAIFDMKKLEWMNSVYIRHHSAQELIAYITKTLDSQWAYKFNNWNQEQLSGFVDLYKERVKTVVELMHALSVIYEMPKSYEQLEYNPQINNYLEALIKELEKKDVLNRAEIETLIKAICAQFNVKLPVLAQPIRNALTGTISSPSIYDMIVLLGKKEAVTRITKFIEFLKK